VPSSSISTDIDPVPPTGRARLSLDLDSKVKSQLEVLRSRSGAASLTEVIRRSLALYDVVTDHQTTGGSIVFKRSDGTEERLVLL